MSKIAANLSEFELQYEDIKPRYAQFNSKNIKQYLTISTMRAKLKSAIKQRKDKRRMVQKYKNKDSKQKAEIGFWLIEAGVRIYAGLTLINKSDVLLTTAAALYLLASAGLIVVTHFAKAHSGKN